MSHFAGKRGIPEISSAAAEVLLRSKVCPRVLGVDAIIQRPRLSARGRFSDPGRPVRWAIVTWQPEALSILRNLAKVGGTRWAVCPGEAPVVSRTIRTGEASGITRTIRAEETSSVPRAICPGEDTRVLPWPTVLLLGKARRFPVRKQTAGRSRGTGGRGLGRRSFGGLGVGKHALAPAPCCWSSRGPSDRIPGRLGTCKRALSPATAGGGRSKTRGRSGRGGRRGRRRRWSWSTGGRFLGRLGVGRHVLYPTQCRRSSRGSFPCRGSVGARVSGAAVLRPGRQSLLFRVGPIGRTYGAGQVREHGRRG